MANPRAPKPPAPPTNPLVGQFFHSFDKNDNVVWQGRVIGAIQQPPLAISYYYFVAIFGWIVERTDNKIVTLDEMKKWVFYNSEADMQWAYEQIYQPRMDRFLAKQERKNG